VQLAQLAAAFRSIQLHPHTARVLLFWLISLACKNLAPQWRFTLAVVLEALWEIIENTNLCDQPLSRADAALGYTGDTVLNSLAT
jgi:hypothetical protein